MVRWAGTKPALRKSQLSSHAARNGHELRTIDSVGAGLVPARLSARTGGPVGTNYSLPRRGLTDNRTAAMRGAMGGHKTRPYANRNCHRMRHAGGQLVRALGCSKLGSTAYGNFHICQRTDF